jgi:hypothetical protein
VAEKALQRVPPPYDGVNTEASPDYVPESQAPVLKNMLCRPGRVVMRGPIWIGGDSGSGKKYDTTGIIVRGAEAIVALNNDWSTAVKKLDLNTATGGVAGPALGPRTRKYARFGIYSYGAPGSVAGGLYRYDGGITAAFQGSTLSPGGKDVVSHLQRLFVLGGSLNGAGGQSSIMWSIPNGPSATPVATDWQDSVSGLYNQAVVGSDDTDDLPVAFARVGRELAIFKDRSIYMLRGQTPATFVIQRFTDNYGLPHPDAVLAVKDGCVFLCDRGLMWFDGAQLVELSQSVRTQIQAAMSTVLFAALPYFCLQYLGDNVLLVAFGQDNNPVSGDISTFIRPAFQFMYDMGRKTWSELSFTSFTPNLAFNGLRTSSGITRWRPFLSDGQYYGPSDTLARPDDAVANTILVSPGNDSIGPNPTPTLRSIPLEWRSRLIRLASPMRAAQLNRLLIDHKMQPVPTSAAINGWQVSLVDGRGTVLLPATNILTEAKPATQLYRRRDTLECFAEADDVQVRMVFPDQGSAPAGLSAAEISDVNIEFQASHLRGSG